jgi:hypothetical protein
MDISDLEKALRFINIRKDGLPAAVHSVVVDFSFSMYIIDINFVHNIYFEYLYLMKLYFYVHK